MIKVDENTCIGCGACVAIDPEHFDFNKDGLSQATKNEVTDSVREAATACPVGAIAIEEEDTAEEAEQSDLAA